MIGPTLYLRALMLEETSIRGRRARIPWAYGHEAETRTQNFPAYGGLILGSAAPSCDEKRRATPVRPGPPQFLIRFPPLLLAQSLPRKRFFGPALLAGFHVEAMLLDFLDDVFLLHLTLKTPQGVLQGFTLLDDDFSHCISSPPIRFGLVSCGTSRQPSSCRIGGELIQWLKSSSKRVNPWRTPCGVLSVRCNRKTSSRKSRSIAST